MPYTRPYVVNQQFCEKNLLGVVIKPLTFLCTTVVIIETFWTDECCWDLKNKNQFALRLKISLKFPQIGSVVWRKFKGSSKVRPFQTRQNKLISCWRRSSDSETNFKVHAKRRVKWKGARRNFVEILSLWRQVESKYVRRSGNKVHLWMIYIQLIFHLIRSPRSGEFRTNRSEYSIVIFRIDMIYLVIRVVSCDFVITYFLSIFLYEKCGQKSNSEFLFLIWIVIG